ncbi:MAG TPA: bifunctional pyr operon transcriptional regulator/uracil phosphoribosyltransferase PyrR [Dehalococcoidia bacterium]|jgi:pyrimidine operon attenuation protein/uracil phosphoribosyltransferase|nr:bifunctional pyr operon transcriptional regulator/uracil phosphoribosyltransferase [Chloroflexota bacterium]MDP5877060.1 bifunctional pyr operon transcriptional regulator/uracil phosphoribosyltransferase PyrR [Dehalococcoidia bacterium]MDP7161436.1 bifunctional pyr operon transcriptional regulator/uracil phosphoribosyltransferase PyrR [Dehalococcoidia bacterium]MDP7213019.1 bifunctional pyr operon transcriptional regulator/uracil phosphoribosyltransferase PyrR [Dehalococcoidia bacterium]MDP7
MTRVFVSQGPGGLENQGRLIMSAEQLRRALVRISHEILERNERPVAVIGMQTRGVDLAHRIADLIDSIENSETDFGTLDPRLYRDDLGGADKPVQPSQISFAIDGRPVVLVDDVLYTGRTIRAALDALLDFGRPSSIQLAVLVDRGHRELPIRADYVGKNVPTARGEDVRVLLEEVDGSDGVALVRRNEAPADSGGKA